MSQALKVHLALNTQAFEASVEFYRAFFGLEPVKLKPGYAKFDVQSPALNLTLNAGPVPQLGALNHLGIQVGSTEEVLAAAARLKAAGLATWEQDNTDCCYAVQDKVWVTDPNGYPWEVFVVKVGDTRPELTLSTAAVKSAPAACCAPAALQEEVVASSASCCGK